MRSFEYYTPTKVIFGKDTHLKIGEILKDYNCHKILIHYGGKSAVKSGLIDDIKKCLTDAGFDFVTLGGVVPNPRLSKVREGISLCRKENIDFILAVGGGSVIDSAKAIGYGVANPWTDVWNFFLKTEVPTACIPIGAIPTIAASGSEMSGSCVITNENGWLKRGSTRSDLCRPKFTLMNPRLTYTLPEYQTESGCVDILMHTMERYFVNIETMEITDSISESLMQTVIYNARILLNEPGNYNARAEIMWAGSLSHNGLTGLGAVTDFAVHQLGHELSAKFDIAHGASLSAVWGAWATYVYPEKPERFAQYAKRVWGIDTEDPKEAAKEAIAKTVAYFKSLDMPTCFSEAKEIGLKTDEEVHKMAYGCSYEGTRTIGNFKTCDIDDMYEIYKLSNK